MKHALTLTLATVLSAAALPAFAQTAPAPAAAVTPAPETEATVTLSPFQVDSSKDTGYAATNTQAGSRLNSRLLDTPSAISVMTADFLQDIGATNIDTAIGFGTNTEVNRNDDNGGYRIRGITSSVSRSRNLFLVSGDQIRADSDLYNIDRVTLSRGPNAILFGNADPAGVIDVETKKADLYRNLGGYTEQLDSFGSGKRESADLNQVIIPGRFALRLDGMYQDINGFRKWSPERDKNIYLAGTAVLIKTDNYSMTAQFDLESDYGTYNYARVSQFSEQESFYQASGSPAVGAYSATVKPVYPTGTKALAASSSTSGAYLVAIPGMATMNWINSGVSNQASILDPNLGKATTAADLPVNNSAIVPINTNLYGPDAGREEDSGRYRTITLTQRFWKDLYLEADFNDFLGHKWRPWSSGGFQTLMIDPNAFLPNGTANPNFGKYYIDRIQQPQDYHFIDSTVRFGLTYQYDLKDLTHSWVGLQRFSSSFDHRKTGRYIDNYVEVNTTPVASASAAAQTTTQFWETNAQNFIDRRYYLDPAHGVIAAGDVNVPVNDNGVNAVLLRVKAPTVTQNRANSFSEALQSFWLKDHLVTTVGFRQDTVDAYQGRTVNIQDFTGVYLPATQELNGTPAAHYAVDTKSLGAVLHIIDEVSVYANKSENFSPDVTRHNIFGNIIPPTVGNGQDYGLKFQFFDDKLSISLGRYKNSKQNFVISGGLVPDDSGIAAIWTALGVTATDPRYPGQGLQYNYTNSNQSEGDELELTYNPTAHWRIRIAADKNNTVFSTYAPELDAYYAQYIGLWSQPQYQALVGNGNTVAVSIQNLQNTMTLTHAQLASAQLVSPYEGNVETSYNFSNGSLLKNFFVGGSESYAAATIIGFPNVNTTDPTKPNAGLTIANTAAPYKGRDVYTTGLWLGYQRAIFERKIMWRLQLNISNALNDKKPIPYGARAQDGAISAEQLREPRKWVLQSTFSY